jgi:hypothetical protein
MKRISKPLIITALFTLILFSTITYFSCNKDKCKAVICYNGGVCNNDTCTCPSGYEGAYCSTLSRTKFLGLWQVAQKGITPEPILYSISITPGNSIPIVLIQNFNNTFSQPVSANTLGTDSLIIPVQVAQGSTISGSAYYKGSSNIQANYTITDSLGNTTVVSAQWGI